MAQLHEADVHDSCSLSTESYHSTNTNVAEKSRMLKKNVELPRLHAQNRHVPSDADQARCSIDHNKIDDMNHCYSENDWRDDDDAGYAYDEQQDDDICWLRRSYSDSELYYRSTMFSCSQTKSETMMHHRKSYSLTSLHPAGAPLYCFDDDDDQELTAYAHDDALMFPPPLLVDDADPLNDFGSEFDAAAYDCGGNTQRIIQRIWKAAWQKTPFQSLPLWLQDNNYLRRYHRPQIQSILECFKTIFRIHSETGNIWTHMLGTLAFLSMLIYMWVAIDDEHLLRSTDKLLLTTYFFGALLCMTFSFLFHTLYCHSDKVGRLFGKLDYCGIACMIVGSFIPWLHYSFYCHVFIKWFYISAITLLAAAAITVSLWNRFGEPKYRALRAGLFLALGLSALVPSGHYLILDGVMKAVECAGFLWLMLMAFLYVFGAILYAVRIPERFFPGRFDIFMHSHQIFHCMVIAAAFVHYHGIMTIMVWRMTEGACEFSLAQVPLAQMMGKISPPMTTLTSNL